jgi:hypothetical protein
MASNKQKNQQSMRIGNITGKNVTIEQNMSMGDNTFSGDERQRQDFLKKLSQVITDLEKYDLKIGTLEGAIAELQSAKEESKKDSPKGTAITRFLRSAKGIIEEVAGGALGIANIVSTIGNLIKMTPTIFK